MLYRCDPLLKIRLTASQDMVIWLIASQDILKARKAGGKAVNEPNY